MPARKSPSAQKPLVFLSHSSANRRELRALKEFLNHRAAGMVEFFLSSDDESIPPGTLWSSEVKAALDRMSLILVFASETALKSPWTYFEAGYAFHSLQTATVYCLKGCSKDSLQPPFNVLQNRNLHSAPELRLLIQHCNNVLDSQMRDEVSKAEFDKIFRPPVLITRKTAPAFHALVHAVEVECEGPPDSLDIFKRACQSLGHPAVLLKDPVPYKYPVHTTDYDAKTEHAVATGIRINVTRPQLTPPFPTEAIEQQLIGDGNGPVSITSSWLVALKDDKTNDQLLQELNSNWTFKQTEIHAHDARIILKRLQSVNRDIDAENRNHLDGPRHCWFRLDPEAYDIATELIDGWVTVCGSIRSRISIEWYGDIHRETRPERIAAAIHGTGLQLGEGSTFIWEKAFELDFPPPDSFSSGGAPNMKIESDGSIGDLDIPDLVSTLWQTGIIYRSK